MDCWDRLQPPRDPTDGLSGRKWMDGIPPGLFLPLAAANANSLDNEDDVHQLLRSYCCYFLKDEHQKNNITKHHKIAFFHLPCFPCTHLTKILTRFTNDSFPGLP